MSRSALLARSYNRCCHGLIVAVLACICGLPATSAEAEKPKPLPYLRLEKDKFVLESEITQKRTKEGSTYVSLTDRGKEKMTLTLHFDKDDQLTSAEAVQETPKSKLQATATFEGDTARIRRKNNVSA